MGDRGLRKEQKELVPVLVFSAEQPQHLQTNFVPSEQQLTQGQPAPKLSLDVLPALLFYCPPVEFQTPEKSLPARLCV